MAEVAIATTLAAPTGHLRRSCIAVRSRITNHRAHSHAAVELTGRAVAPRAAVVIDATVAVDEAPVAVGAGRRITTMARHVARAVRVLEALVVGAHHVAPSELNAPSVDSVGAVRVLLTVSPWRWSSIGSAHCWNPSRRSVVGASRPFSSAMLCENARSAGLGVGRAIIGTGGIVTDGKAGIDWTARTAIYGTGGTTSVAGTAMDYRTCAASESPSAYREGRHGSGPVWVIGMSHAHTVRLRAAVFYRKALGTPAARDPGQQEPPILRGRWPTQARVQTAKPTWPRSSRSSSRAALASPSCTETRSNGSSRFSAPLAHAYIPTFRFRAPS
jgi:hypothetical protein